MDQQPTPAPSRPPKHHVVAWLIIAFIVVVAVLAVAVYFVFMKKAPIEDLKTVATVSYVDDIIGFSFEYPETWKTYTERDGDGGALIVFETDRDFIEPTPWISVKKDLALKDEFARLEKNDQNKNITARQFTLKGYPSAAITYTYQGEAMKEYLAFAGEHTYIFSSRKDDQEMSTLIRSFSPHFDSFFSHPYVLIDNGTGSYGGRVYLVTEGLKKKIYEISGMILSTYLSPNNTYLPILSDSQVVDGRYTTLEIGILNIRTEEYGMIEKWRDRSITPHSFNWSEDGNTFYYAEIDHTEEVTTLFQVDLSMPSNKLTRQEIIFDDAENLLKGNVRLVGVVDNIMYLNATSQAVDAMGRGIVDYNPGKLSIHKVYTVALSEGKKAQPKLLLDLSNSETYAISLEWYSQLAWVEDSMLKIADLDLVTVKSFEVDADLGGSYISHISPDSQYVVNTTQNSTTQTAYMELINIQTGERDRFDKLSSSIGGIWTPDSNFFVFKAEQAEVLDVEAKEFIKIKDTHEGRTLETWNIAGFMNDMN